MKKSELEAQGIGVFEQEPGPRAVTEEEAQFAENYQDFIKHKEPEQEPKPKTDYESWAIKILKAAMYVFSLQVLTYLAAGGSFFLFFQAINKPSGWSFTIATVFSVVVFIPTLYYSRNYK